MLSISKFNIKVNKIQVPNLTKSDRRYMYNSLMKEGINIYVDVYFFINFVVDYLSLFSVGRIMLFPVSKKRCFLAAVIGAAYSLAHFFLRLPILLHITASVIMVLCISCKRRLLSVTVSVVVFLCCEIFIGGCVTALKELSTFISGKSMVLFAFIILIAVAGNSIFSIVQFIMRKRLEVLSLNARICHRGKCSELMLMVDSGNLVREHSTKKRVIFVRADAIENTTGEIDTLFERERCYVIPIDTTSGRGTVLGFIPDKIEFSDKKYNNEEFIVVPDIRGGKYGGYDGIAPLI